MFDFMTEEAQLTASYEIGPFEAVLKLIDLKSGWHYGSGRTPSRDSISVALAAVAFMRQFGWKQFDAFPDLDGGVLISAYSPDLDVDVFCHPSRMIDLFREVDGHETDRIRNLQLKQALNVLRDDRWRPQNLSSYLTPITMTKRNIDTIGWHLKTQRETVEFQSSTPPALQSTGYHYATTLRNIIQPESQATLHHSGASQAAFFRAA